jgi:hypothetical protein
MRSMWPQSEVTVMMSLSSILFMMTMMASSVSCTAVNMAATTTTMTTTLSYVHPMVLPNCSTRAATTSNLYGKRSSKPSNDIRSSLRFDHETKCDAYSLHERQRQSNIQFIAKTVESFKLADLYWLESCIMAHCQSESTQQPISSETVASRVPWAVRKLAFHRPTASYLLGCFTAGDSTEDGCHEIHHLSQSPYTWVNVPFRNGRCQYVAQVIATGQSPQELLDNISMGASSDAKKWTLDYDVLEPLLKCSMHPKRSFSSTMLMCAVARILPGEPLLTSTTQRTDEVVSYMIIETSSQLYLTLKQSCNAGVSNGSKSDLQNLFRTSWARRPFQYSGAINLDVAIAVVDILRDLIRRNNNPRSVRMLDPTCGSGTFLALALMTWSADCNVEVTGIDSNPKCSLGSAQNLQYLFRTSSGENNVIVESIDVDTSWSLILNSNITHTSARANIYSGNSMHLQYFISHKFDCAVANLPWNRNTFEFQGGIGNNKCINSRILEATAAALLPGSPFVVISGGSQREKQSSQLIRNELDLSFNARQCLESIGFQVLGEATVPPRGFHLPVSGKNADVSTLQEQHHRSSDCLITVAVAPCTT